MQFEQTFLNAFIEKERMHCTVLRNPRLRCIKLNTHTNVPLEPEDPRLWKKKGDGLNAISRGSGNPDWKISGSSSRWPDVDIENCPWKYNRVRSCAAAGISRDSQNSVRSLVPVILRSSFIYDFSRQLLPARGCGFFRCCVDALWRSMVSTSRLLLGLLDDGAEILY